MSKSKYLLVHRCLYKHEHVYVNALSYMYSQLHKTTVLAVPALGPIDLHIQEGHWKLLILHIQESHWALLTLHIQEGQWALLTLHIQEGQWALLTLLIQGQWALLTLHIQEGQWERLWWKGSGRPQEYLVWLWAVGATTSRLPLSAALVYTQWPPH